MESELLNLSRSINLPVRVKTSNILICDINICEGGHYIVYNQFLLDFFDQVEKENPSIKISFLYNKEAQELLSFNKYNSERVSFITNSLPRENGFHRRQVIVKYLATFTRANHIDRVIFMDLDKYQL